MLDFHTHVVHAQCTHMLHRVCYVLPAFSSLSEVAKFRDGISEAFVAAGGEH